MKSLRIVFMGTPEFAATSLDAICRSRHEVVGVVTVADKPAGRGLQLQSSPVKSLALQHNIPVLQPLKLKDPVFLEVLKAFQADLFVVVAFRMLPEVVWNMPPLGSINLHGSMLPKYRGAAPINRAIMNGETETGVTIFFLQHEIDTGKVIARESMPIGPDTTAGELHDVMMHVGATALVNAIDCIADGKAEAVEQNQLVPANEAMPYAPKIFKEDCRIDWSQSVATVHNHIRGLSPYPAAWTELEGRMFKIFGGNPIHGRLQNEPVETDGKSYLNFRCA
ncbi:MAG: methionyl-tRNA formyltransferase, partial [Flavobacteriales bacterium]